ncbi:MAG TPA: OmpA family protein [Rubrivivax sp.]|nr:OmpA family protein [Rubrivivax sp.]
MKTLHSFGLFALAGMTYALASPAAAQDDSYGYGGLSIGASRAKIDESRITTSLTGAGLTTSNFARDESDTSYKLFGGYRFNRYFAVEGGYFNLGKFGFTSTTAPAGTLTGQLKAQGLNLDLLAMLPLGERISLFGRIGAQTARVRDNFSTTGAVSILDASPSKTAANYKLGGGVQYEVNRSFLVRAEAERYRIDDAVGNKGDVNVVSLSVVFPFGRSPVTTRAAPVSAYVPPAAAMPAAPAPVVAAAPPPPAPPVVAVMAPELRRVSFSAASLFGFDQSSIKPEGKAALDNFARETRATRFDVITVQGHTDRLGSSAYNERLSQQRADAVRGYLVAAGGLDGSKVTAVGKGETSPVTAAETCKGNQPRQALIACLQPDRRVDVEVSGTR